MPRATGPDAKIGQLATASGAVGLGQWARGMARLD